MRRLAAALVAALGLALGEARADPPEIVEALPGAERVGEARFTYLVWPVFDAELFTRSGAFDWSEAFALSLTYRRGFSADALTGQTIEEMRARGVSAQVLAGLRPRLRACFADVSAGDRFTAVSLTDERASLFFNGAYRCTLNAPGLRQAFFGIWLDGRSNATFSARLRGA